MSLYWERFYVRTLNSHRVIEYRLYIDDRYVGYDTIRYDTIQYGIIVILVISL